MKWAILRSLFLMIALTSAKSSLSSGLNFNCHLQNFQIVDGKKKAEENEYIQIKFENFQEGLLIFGESNNILIFATTIDFEGVSNIVNKSNEDVVNIAFNMNDIEIHFIFNSKNGSLKSVGKKRGSNKILETSGNCTKELKPAKQM